MNVVNIGIIIRNDHGDTFPVALTPKMVSKVQKMLAEIPVMKSNIVDVAGRKVASGQESIPIIPRYVEFDWDKAYHPMMPDEEATLMAELQTRYNLDEKKIKSEPSDAALIMEAIGIDKDSPNPFNMELKASGRANSDMGKQGNDAETNNGDCTVAPDTLSISGEQEKI
jgi:hypothetical protein